MFKQAAEQVPFWRSTNIFTANEISRMQEVQFTSDLTINLLQGLSDYSPALLRRYYKDYDEDFQQTDEIARRMEAVFSKLAALDPKNFSDTIFRSAQVAFSLMYVLDHLRRRAISNQRIQDVMRKIDAEVTGYLERDEADELANRYISGFTSGNLHRIKARTIRNEILLEALS